MTDIPRLMKVIDHIASLPHPSEEMLERLADGTLVPVQDDAWVQDIWNCTGQPVVISEAGVQDMTGQRCGTAGCLAGHAVFMFGENGTKLDGSSVTLPDGRNPAVDVYATELLELSELNAADLFKAGNSISRIRSIAAAIERREALG